MEDDAELRDEDLPEERETSFLDLGDDGDLEQEDVDGEPPELVEAATGWEWRPPPPSASHEAKLRELLRDLCSPEATIHSEASRELVALLRGDSGGDILLEYIRGSPRCSELADAWKLRQGKPGMAHVLSLVATVLGHPFGKSRAGGIWRNIDSLARSIITLKLDDLYVELKSEEGRRQAAALSLLAAVVRRGMSLASEVAKIFNFKLPVLPKLAGVQKKKGGREMKHRARRSTRRAFVEFAMSFLEVGNPRLLRWILQQKEMYSGALRGLGSDDLETVVYVLSTLRDKVLCADSLVPPGLRSVLFGSATLEQLSHISGNPTGGEAADVAHEVLVMVCTDPCNGLMPDANLKGNVKRLCDLMKKLEATNSAKHRDLLLAVMKGRPFLCSSYMDEFPYHLEPQASRPWYSAISLAADLISSVNVRPSFSFLTASKSSDPPSLDSVDLKHILKCIVPRTCTRSVINKGLLHFDMVVKHGSLRLLLESLRLLDNLNNVIQGLLDKMRAKPSTVAYGETALSYLKNFHVLEGASHDDKKVSISSSHDTDLQKWMSLKEEIQDEVRAVLPDSQVLLKLLMSFTYKNSETSRSPLKRCRNSSHLVRKKLKSDVNNVDGEVDIVLSVVDSEFMTNTNEDYEKVEDADGMDTESDHRVAMAEIWGPEIDPTTKETEDVAIFFHAKLLEVLKFYLRTLPLALEGSFDFIKILPSNPAILSTSQQKSMLSLLAEYIGQPPGRRASKRVPDMMYKSLQPLISLLIFSPIQSIRNQAFALARAAMLSTGAFDYNPSEIEAWFLFLPGYGEDKHSKEFHVTEEFRDLSAVVISFLCDAVSTVGNNLHKYLDHMHVFVSKLGRHEDYCPDFSPLVICILQKCIRVLESESRTFKIPERSMISLYVCNTLSFILQAQVDMKVLPSLVDLFLSEKFKEASSADGRKCRRSLCDWRPLNDLLLLAQRIFHQQACDLSLFLTGRASEGNVGSFSSVVCRVSEFLEQGDGDGLVAVATAMCFSVICATSDDLVENFPILLAIAQHIPKAHIQFLSFILLLQHEFVGNVANRWPDMFSCGLDMVASCIDNNFKGIDAYEITRSPSACRTDGLIHTSDVDSIQSLAASFSLILEHASFHALFCGVVNSFNCKLFRSNKMLEVLHAKLDEESIGNCILSLRVVLFWAYQIRSCYVTQQTGDLVRMFEFCLNLVDHILDKILVYPSAISTLEGIDAPIITDYIFEVADIIFHHPIVTLSILHPIRCEERPFLEFIGDNLGAFLESSKQNVHIMDYRNLRIFTRVGEFMLDFENDLDSAFNLLDTIPESIPKAFLHLLQQLVSLLKKKFDLYITTKDVGSLFPVFYIFFSLARFISPFELVDLAEWMFCNISDRLDNCVSKKASAFSVCFYVTNIALDMLQNHFRQTDAKASWSLWESRNRTLPVSSLQNVYNKILDFAILFKLDSAGLCLMKAVNAIYSKKLTQSLAALPSNMQLCRMIMSSPMKLITHCIHETDKMKARTILELIEVSPLHSSLFGLSLLGLIKELSSTDISNMKGLWPPNIDMINGTYTLNFSDEDLMLLLPAALSYLASVYSKCRKHDVKLFRCIPSFYSRIILKGLSHWRSYCSGELFLENFANCKPKSAEQFLDYFNNTLLGKAIHMLHFNSILSGGSMKKKHRLNIFDSVFDCVSLFDQLFDCDVREINPHSYKASLNLVNRAVAKISFAKLLLFPPGKLEDDGRKESSKKTSNAENYAKVRFLNILFDSLHNLVTRIPLNPKHCNDADCNYVFKFLEIYILRNVVQLCSGVKNYLIQLPSITFLKPFIRSSLLHRFEDPTTLRAIRIILCTLGAKSSSVDILELLLGHSEFVATILWNNHNMEMSSSINTGTLLQPLPSIFKLLKNFSPAQELMVRKLSMDASSGSGNNQYSLQNRKLELVKLLRVLFHLKNEEQNACLENIAVNCRELLSLLLSGYGATLSEIDLETLHLMHEIELMEGPDPKNIAAMDYLWGISAVKLRQEHRFDQLVSLSKIADFETEDEQRRRFFRENVILDSRCCLTTVLNFCYDRAKRTEIMSMNNLLHDNVMNTPEQTPSQDMNKIQPYDPVFLLPFSIHALSRGYLEPVEFVRLGLLAVALVSISSPDEEIRKMGYEVLGIFKMTLENHRKTKDILQLRLLLTYLQNGITEAWQKVPSVTAMFAAEAAFIVLDPSHNNFQIISKFLLHSPKVDLKVLNIVVSLRSISEWLKDDALEQLSELSQFLYTLFVGSLKSLKENVSLMTSILCAIISTLRISQKRKIFQPHFTLSIDALLCLSQAIECELKDTRFHPVVQQGLTTILMSTPPPIRCPKDKDKLYNLAMWAMSAALQSDQMQIGFVDKSYPDFMNLEEHPREEPVFSKLLRWITASINLGSVSDRYNERKMSFCLEESKADTLQLRLRRVMRKDFENEEHCFHSNEDLAAIILHLQYLLRMECAASPSIVSALCLLLSGTKSWDEDQGNLVMLLCGKIRCPPEANPSWRWSFYQPWRDLSLEQTDLQNLEEQQTCQILLLLLSNFLGTKSDFRNQLYQDVEHCGLFAWERSLIVGDG